MQVKVDRLIKRSIMQFPCLHGKVMVKYMFIVTPKKYMFNVNIMLFLLGSHTQMKQLLEDDVLRERKAMLNSMIIL